jgi:hypothetical protein
MNDVRVSCSAYLGSVESESCPIARITLTEPGGEVGVLTSDGCFVSGSAPVASVQAEVRWRPVPGMRLIKK